MQIALFTNPEEIQNEAEILHQMAELSIDYIVLRKPLNDTDYLLAFTEQLSPLVLSKLIVSDIEVFNQFKVKGFHFSRTFIKNKTITVLQNLKNSIQQNNQISSISCHNIQTLETLDNDYDLVFISPVFNSISKENEPSRWDIDELKTFLIKPKTKTNFLALGGVNFENIKKIKETGFDGVGILGYIWTKEGEPLERLTKIHKLCH